jgi:hypothetical protein
MTDDDATTEPPARPTPVERPPRYRADPAEMRETLDAARRRLGPDDATGATAPSAERQRALLREAAANHAAPLSAGPSSSPPAPARDLEPDDDPPVDTDP